MFTKKLEMGITMDKVFISVSKDLYKKFLKITKDNNYLTISLAKRTIVKNNGITIAYSSSDSWYIKSDMLLLLTNIPTETAFSIQYK